MKFQCFNIVSFILYGLSSASTRMQTGIPFKVLTDSQDFIFHRAAVVVNINVNDFNVD